MEYDPRSSTGSTVSGDFNKILNPFGYIYISHPFGTVLSAQKQNIKKLKFNREGSTMSFRCPEYYRTKIISHQNSVNDISPDGIKYKNGNNVIFEVPDFKYIIDSIQRAWCTRNFPLNSEFIKSNNNNYSQEDERIRTDSIFKRRKELIRRYSVPETAIRKYKFIFEHTATTYSNNMNLNLPMDSKSNNLHKNYKDQKQIVLLKSEQKMESPPVNFLNKDETKIEILKKKQCFYCSSKSNNSIEKFEQNSKKSINSFDSSSTSTIKSNNLSDIFISNLLIRNLNEDMTIANLLISNLNNDNLKTKQNQKEKNYVSSIYFSPERLLRNVDINKDLTTYVSWKEIKLKTNKSSHCAEQSEENIHINNVNNVQIIAKLPTPEIINNSLNKINGSDINKAISTIETGTFPIKTKKICENELNFICHDRKITKYKNDYESLIKQDKFNSAHIQANLKKQIIERGFKIGNNFKTPLLEDFINTPHSKPRTNSQSILNSLEAYTIDSGGNINFRVLSSAISKHEPSNGDLSGKSFQNKNTSASSNVRKITIFEAQSNMVTPDNDNGPKRFYQKTEIVNGDKKIDILEIVECIQNSMYYGPKSLFNTKVSKIPILIDKVKCLKNKNPLSTKDIVHLNLPKFEVNKKQKNFNKYDQNLNKNIMNNDKSDLNTSKYPLENVTKSQYKINSKIQAVKPLRPLTENILKDVPLTKCLNVSKEVHKEQYSTCACNSTITDRSLQNTITPISSNAIHGLSSNYKRISEEYLNKTDFSPSFRTKTKLDPIPNLVTRNNLENNKILKQPICQYDWENSNDYKRQNKLNAWRIPSSDFYNKNKPNMAIKIDSIPKILPQTSNTESTMRCNNNCQLCSCCSTFTSNSHILYSPTLSVCSLCSKMDNSERLTTCNTDYITSSENKLRSDFLNTSKGKDIINKNFPPITNRTCECMTENLNVHYLCNEQHTSGLCPYSRCSKRDELIFPEGVLSNSHLGFTSEGLITSSSIADSHWTNNGLLSCNWKLNKKQTTNKSSDKNINSKPVWTVTVSTKRIREAPDLTMEFKFPQPPTELSIGGNTSEKEENDNSSLDSDNSVKKTNHHVNSGEFSRTMCSPENKYKTIVADKNFENYYDDFGGYSLNIPRLLSKRNDIKLKTNSNNLSVMGCTLHPEEKPRVQTMTERDLTRRKHQKTFNHFSTQKL